MKSAFLFAMLEIVIGGGRAQIMPAQLPGQNPNAPGEPGTAGFRTNPDLEILMERADRFATEDRYDLASELWQKVIDESEDSVVTRPEWKQKTFRNTYQRFKPMLAEIESRLAQLPAEGLNAYRLRADGEAKALLADAERNEEMLAKVVRRYFLSSEGDDAALALATQQLDRYELVSAIHLLQRVLSFYPDSNIPRGHLLLRLAAAHARVGDVVQARAAVKELREKHAGQVPAYVLTAMERDMEKRGAGVLAAPAVKSGTVKLDQELAALWTQRYDVKFPEGLPSLFNLGNASESQPYKPEDMVRAWREKKWFPTGSVKVRDGRLFFKADKRLICCDPITGKVLWMGHRNEYPVDDISNSLRQNLRNAQRAFGYTSLVQVQFFGDRIYQDFAIHGDTLYNIEGKPSYLQEPAQVDNRRNYYYYGRDMRRTRSNWLSAYDVQSGKLRWHIKAPVFDSKESRSAFMAAPVPYAAFLLVPVSDGHTQWLVALDRASGKQVWKRFLCDEPSSYSSPYSPVAVTVEGGEAYLSTGAGLVFALDAVTGSLRWAVSYPRVFQGDIWRQLTAKAPDAWAQDTVIPSGKQLLVMASDSNHLVALDRRNGELLWESPLLPTPESAPGKYALGVREGKLYIAGNEVVRCYEVDGGRMQWETTVPVSVGRGLLQPDAVYLPLENDIARLDLETGKVLSQVRLASAVDEPIGNLYSDGEAMYALGFRRVARLGGLAGELERLQRQVEAGDVESIRARMRLHSLTGRDKEAVQDLEALYGYFVNQEKYYLGAQALFEAIRDLDLVAANPGKVIQLLQVERQNAPRIQGREEREIKDLDRERALIEYEAQADQTSQAGTVRSEDGSVTIRNGRGVIRVQGGGVIRLDGNVIQGVEIVPNQQQNNARIRRRALQPQQLQELPNKAMELLLEAMENRKNNNALPDIEVEIK